MNNYTLGQSPKLQATFRDDAGTLTDPTTVVFKVRTPGGVETTYTSADGVANDSPGVWSYQLAPLDEAGTWAYRVVGTGALDAAGEAQLFAERSYFASP